MPLDRKVVDGYRRPRKYSTAPAQQNQLPSLLCAFATTDTYETCGVAGCNTNTIGMKPLRDKQGMRN